jgi:hypothetical protein
VVQSSDLLKEECHVATGDTSAVYSRGGGPDRGAGAAATTGQLKQQSTFVDWDFEETWMLCEGETYPHLWWEGLTCGQ